MITVDTRVLTNYISKNRNAYTHVHTRIFFILSISNLPFVTMQIGSQGLFKLSLYGSFGSPENHLCLWAIGKYRRRWTEQRGSQYGVDGDVLYLSVQKSWQQSELGSSRNCHTQQSHRWWYWRVSSIDVSTVLRWQDAVERAQACVITRREPTFRLVEVRVLFARLSTVV